MTSIDEGVLSELNRFDTIPRGNVKVMISRSMKVHVPFMNCLSYLSTGTSGVEAS